MKSWHRYAIGITLGLIGGVGVAVQQVRGGVADALISNGAWSTNVSYGSANASALTRAKVALGRIMALPAKEAMYFTATKDSDGRTLNGGCTYLVSGGKLDGRWWSVTLYEGEGWLVKNAANRWSIPAHAAEQADNGRWSFTVSPEEQPTTWLPTGNAKAFDMTLRLYHPSPAVIAAPAKAALPIIKRQECT